MPPSPKKNAAKKASKETVAVAAKPTSSTSTLPAFERSLPILLMHAREAVMQRFRPLLRKHDITEQQWRILRVLAEQPSADMLELSVRCGIQPPSLSRTVPLLIERGLLKRTNHSVDQRRVLVSLTARGKSVFRVMSVESLQIYQLLEENIGSTRLTRIYRALDDLISLEEGESTGSSED